jgi:homospermidine synthase
MGRKVIQMKVPFSGRILMIGCGYVGRCTLPLLLKHLRMPAERITVLDFADCRAAVTDALAQGVRYEIERITPDNLGEVLARHVGTGDLVLDLAWNIGCVDILQWCHDHGVLYLNTSVELWDPYVDAESQPPAQRTLYVRHMAIRDRVNSWLDPDGPTAVLEHGANPGLVSHFTKVALRDIARKVLREKPDDPRRADLEKALHQKSFNRLAMLTGVKVIHISERDTQVTSRPKEVNEFVNTWSIEGFREEGVAPAEMGWGTHERRLPPGAHVHAHGPGNQICLAQMGIKTWVRSWVPSGEIVGMVVRHGEAFTLSDHLTVWQNGRPVYRPTVHYAYCPTDAAIASLLELEMRWFDLQKKQRILTDEIESGRDELGVLLLGHDFNGWWTGSLLDIHESRELVPGQNATTLQVACSVLAAALWMIRNPCKGVCVPDDLPYEEILETAMPYLGPCISEPVDWTPLKNRVDLFARFGKPRPGDEDAWQFESFVI